MQIWSLIASSVVPCDKLDILNFWKIKDISANNKAMLLKLGRDVASYKIYKISYWGNQDAFNLTGGTINQAAKVLEHKFLKDPPGNEDQQPH